MRLVMFKTFWKVILDSVRFSKVPEGSMRFHRNTQGSTIFHKIPPVSTRFHDVRVSGFPKVRWGPPRFSILRRFNGSHRFSTNRSPWFANVLTDSIKFAEVP